MTIKAKEKNGISYIIILIAAIALCTFIFLTTANILAIILAVSLGIIGVKC